MPKESNRPARRRKRPAVVFAAALVLGFGTVAEASVIESLPIPRPETAPFRPYLVEGEEAPLCQALLGLAENAFFSRAYAVDIRGMSPNAPGYRFIKWPFTDNSEENPYSISYRFGSDQVVAVFDKAALFGEGLVIAWSQWSHSWRGKSHMVQTFSSLGALHEALGPVATDALERARQFAGGIGLSLDSSVAPTLIEDEQRYFVLEGYHDDERRRVEDLTLSPVAIEGKGGLLCRIRLEPPDVFLHGPESVAQLFDLLDLVTGEDCSRSGTTQALARLKLLIEGYPSRVLLRPWAATTEPYNTRSTVDLWLQHWSEQSLSQAVTYKKLQAALHETESDLQHWYQFAFGYDAQVAAEASAFMLDWLLRQHFSFAAASTPPPPGTNSVQALTRAILTGRPLDDVTATLQSVLASETEAQTILSETLANALGRPEVLDHLTSQGVDLNRGNEFGKTALMYAAHLNFTEAARTLLNKGADPNRRTRKLSNSCPVAVFVGERTALFYAAENASADMIRLLVERGADVTAVDSRGFGALQYLELNEALTPREREELKALLQPN